MLILPLKDILSYKNMGHLGLFFRLPPNSSAVGRISYTNVSSNIHSSCQGFTTYHRVGRVLSFSSSRWNWDSPTPHPPASVPLPPGFGGRGTLADERGVGRVPIRRGDIHCGTFYFLYIRTLCY